MNIITIIVELAKNNYAAYCESLPGCIATGKTFDELKANMEEAVHLHIETSLEFNEAIPDKFKSPYELIYRFDAKSLLQHYRGIFTNSALERLTGINQRQLQRYASGESKPRAEQSDKIKNALHAIGQELLTIEL